MIRGNLPKFNFQTFYIAKEESNCPLIAEVMSVSKKLKDVGLIKNINETVVSLRYGKRVLMNAHDSDFIDVKHEDFIEIIDYDPLKKVLLIIGPKEPKIDTPVHWLIHHARSEVNAVIQINDVDLAGQLVKKLPVTKDNYPSGTFEQAREILKCLRDNKGVVIKNQGILFVGSSLNEVEDLVIKNVRS